MPHVYMLRCADGTYYVGSTRNLDHRMRQHGSGRGAKYTSTRMPVELVWAHETERIAGSGVRPTKGRRPTRLR